MSPTAAIGPPNGSGGRLGCLGPIVGVVVLVGVVVAVAAVGLVVLVVVAGVALVGLVAFAVDRLLLAVSPTRRRRRDDLLRSWGLGGPERTAAAGRGRPDDGRDVIDTTATVEGPVRRSPPDRDGTGEA